MSEPSAVLCGVLCDECLRLHDVVDAVSRLDGRPLCEKHILRFATKPAPAQPSVDVPVVPVAPDGCDIPEPAALCPCGRPEHHLGRCAVRRFRGKVRSCVTSFNLCEETDERFLIGCVILAPLFREELGHDPKAISQWCGIALPKVRQFVTNLKTGNVWIGGKFHCDDCWGDEKRLYEWRVLFALLVLVGEGTVVRVPRATGL
jgi:hypothetical protein